MMYRHYLIVGVAALLVSGCQRHQSVAPPHVKLNPMPKDHYEVSLSLQDDPGDITRVSAAMNYTVANTDCLPTDYTKALGGIKPKFSQEKELPVMRKGNAYVAMVAEDEFLPENYYGLGTCHWKVGGIAFFLHRGPVTNVALPPVGYQRMPEVKSERMRCAYEGNTASSDGRDPCGGESAPTTRRFFSINVQIRKVRQ